MKITEPNLTRGIQEILKAAAQPGADMNFERLTDEWILPDDTKVAGPVDYILTIRVPGEAPPEGSTLAVRPNTLMKAVLAVCPNISNEDRSKITSSMYKLRNAINDAVFDILLDAESDEEE